MFILFCLHATLGYHNVLLEWKFMKLLLKRRAADSIENEDERALYRDILEIRCIG